MRRAGAIVAASGPILDAADLQRFRDGLAAIHESPVGEGRLSGAEPHIRVRVAASDGRGELRVRVELTPDPDYQGHWFEYAVDQSYLPETIRQLDAVLELFPVRGRAPDAVDARPALSAVLTHVRRAAPLRVLHRFARRRAGVRRWGSRMVELCARLDMGGTTPDIALIERCVASLTILVFVMIRPRAGDFVYDAGDVAAMMDDIRAAAAAGAHGVVFGALRRDATIDAAIVRRLIDVARPLPVTCHKAIDATRDPIESLDALLALGVDRVLTSGGADTAVGGAKTIARMVARAGDALVVMAGGGVRAPTWRRSSSRPVSAKCTPASCPTVRPHARRRHPRHMGRRISCGGPGPSSRERLSGSVPRLERSTAMPRDQRRRQDQAARECRQRRRPQEWQVGEHAADDHRDQQPGPDAALNGNARHLEWRWRIGHGPIVRPTEAGGV